MIRLCKRLVAAALAAAFLFSAILPAPPEGSAQGNSRTFAETGKTVSGPFLTYWDAHGGLAQQGFPLSNTFNEKSATNGKVYMVQYFERAEFELHPENKPPNNVLLSLLGVFRYDQKYPNGAPGQKPNTTLGSVNFKETGHRVGGKFLAYWNTHGGLAQQGYPISDEFTEKSDLNGKTYVVQYFQRAVFEMHPENKPPYDVLLSQLGTYLFHQNYGARGCISPMKPGVWNGPYTNSATFKNSTISGALTATGTINLNVVCDGSFTGTDTVTKGEYHYAIPGSGTMTCKGTVTQALTGTIELNEQALPRFRVTSRATKQSQNCTGPTGTTTTPPYSLSGSDMKYTVQSEKASATQVSGTDWSAGPAVAGIEDLIKVFGAGPLNKQITGHWVLNLKQ